MSVHANSLAKSPAIDTTHKRNSTVSTPFTIHALTRLQRLIGNHAMGQLLHTKDPGRVSSRQITKTTSDVQRLVVVLKDKKANKDEKTEDTTELNSIAFALSRTKGPVVTLSEADFSKVEEHETIFVIGHGSRRSASGHEAKDFLKVFLDPERGIPRNSKATIVFTSCFAGADAVRGPGEFDPNSSLIAEISMNLKPTHPGLTVIGGIGPTIKGNAVGNLFYVAKADPKSVARKEQIKRKLVIAHGIAAKYEQWLTGYQTNNNGRSPSLEEKAAKAGELCEPFTKEFVTMLLEEKLVYNPSNPEDLNTSIRAYRAGHELQTAMKLDLVQQVLSPRISTSSSSSSTPAPAAAMSSSSSTTYNEPSEKPVMST